MRELRIKLTLEVKEYQLLILHFLCLSIFVQLGKGKGKAIPLQAWTSPEGYRRLRLPDFNTIGT
jgi:hypothetical protein